MYKQLQMILFIDFKTACHILLHYAAPLRAAHIGQNCSAVMCVGNQLTRVPATSYLLCVLFLTGKAVALQV